MEGSEIIISLRIYDKAVMADPKHFFEHVIPFLMQHKNGIVEYHVTDGFRPALLQTWKDIQKANGEPFFDVNIQSDYYKSDEIIRIKCLH